MSICHPAFRLVELFDSSSSVAIHGRNTNGDYRAKLGCPNLVMLGVPNYVVLYREPRIYIDYVELYSARHFYIDYTP